MEKDRRDTEAKDQDRKAGAQESKAGDKPSLTITRHLKAPPSLVYQAWTDPEKLMRWFGPDAGPTLSASADVTVGGRYHIVFQTQDGEEHDVSGLYREVIPNEKLVFTWMWRTMPERVSLVTVTMKAEGDGTGFTLLHEQFHDEPGRGRHLDGWTGAINKLEKMLAA